MKILRDKTKESLYTTQRILNMLKRGDLRKDHPLQRKSDQWDNATRDGFIATIIKEEDCDSIKICEEITSGGVILWLIDGLQRITTLDKFKNNLFKLGKNIEFPIIEYQHIAKNENGEYLKDENGEILYEDVSFDLRGKYYSDLPDQLQEVFDIYPFKIVKHLDCNAEQIGYHIRRYNHQVSMNSTQNAITYMDGTARFVKELSENHSFFKNCCNLTLSKRKKGVADKIVSEAMMGLFGFNEWKKATKQIGLYLNKNITKQDFLVFKDYLDRLEQITTVKTSVLFTEKNALIWFMLFDRFNKLEVADFNFGNFMTAFVDSLQFKLVGDNSFDSLDKNRSTKDKWIIEAKLELLYTLLCDYLDMSTEEVTAELDTETQNFVKEFCESDLMELIDIDVDEADKEFIALKSLEVTGGEGDDTLLYAESAKDWLLEIKDYEKLPLKYAIPSLIGFIQWVYKEDYTDKQGVEWLKDYIRQGSFTSDIEGNLCSLKNTHIAA